jgi:predicted RNA binding protein YcfA (HicA-like mRNA interferase family)
MPKLPILNSKKIIRILKHLGFSLNHTTGSHYIFYHPTLAKHVSVPYHNSDLPKGTLLNILKQAGITKTDLTKLL